MVHNDKYKFVAIVNEKIEEHNYFGLLAFGEIDKINPITKRLSLFK